MTSGELAMAEDYIRSLVPGGFVVERTARRAETVLLAMQQRLPWAGAPTIAPGGDGSIGFTWRTERHYLHATIPPAGAKWELFFENLVTGKMVHNEYDDEAAPVAPHGETP